MLRVASSGVRAPLRGGLLHGGARTVSMSGCSQRGDGDGGGDWLAVVALAAAMLTVLMPVVLLALWRGERACGAALRGWVPESTGTSPRLRLLPTATDPRVAATVWRWRLLVATLATMANTVPRRQGPCLQCRVA